MPKRDHATAFTKHKALVPFWNSDAKRLSERLWSCTHDECVASEQASWDLVLRDLGTNTWFTVRQSVPVGSLAVPGRWPVWRGLAVPRAVADPTAKPAVSGLRKVRVYPTPEQQATIKTWMGAVRWTYNRAVSYLNDKSTKGKRNAKDVRAFCVNDEIMRASKRHNWMGVIPYDVRDEGARDALKSVGSNMAKQRIRKSKGLPFSFKLHYRRKKHAFQETLTLHSKHWQKTRGVYFDLFGKSGSKLAAAEDLPLVLAYDVRLVRTRLNEYYLCIPTGHVALDENQVPDTTEPFTVSLDPGVRTFMTAYDPSGRVVEWGAGDFRRIRRLRRCTEQLESRYASTNHRTRYRLRRAALRIRRKIRRIVDELHYKLVQWLCRTYKAIIIPVFETRAMANNKDGKRKLNRQSTADMCTWSHYRFRTNLVNKAKSFPGVTVIETTEEFTSKTCGKCGELNDKLGGSKLFTCAACGFHSDRDFNGARNILIRHLTMNA